MIIDLHAHTAPHSDDSRLDPHELIQQAKRSGLDGICLTEHDFFWEKEDVARLSREHDFPIFPGVEINTEEGHLIVFGLTKYIFGMHHAQFVRQLVDEVGGAIILAHPYRRLPRYNPTPDLAVELACQNPIFDLVDAVEELNGKAKDEENSFSQEICRRLNLRGIGGSDAHSTSDIASCATLFQRRVTNLRELVVELKEGRFSVIDLRQS